MNDMNEDYILFYIYNIRLMAQFQPHSEYR